MADDPTNVKENPKENPTEDTSKETSKQAKVSLAEIQQSELFRRTQAEKDKAISQSGKLQSQLDSLQDQLEALTLRQQEALISETGNPEVAKKILQELQTAKKELKSKERELGDARTKIEALAPLEKLSDARKVSEETGCPIDVLMEAETLAEMVGIGKGYAKSTKTEKVESKTKEEILPAKVDSGVSSPSSAGRIWKQSEIGDMSPDQRFAMAKEIAKAMKEGRIDPTR